MVAAARLDVGHFLNASSFAEGFCKYTLGHGLCCIYKSQPYALVDACTSLPSTWLTKDDYMQTIFGSEFVEHLFEKPITQITGA